MRIIIAGSRSFGDFQLLTNSVNEFIRANCPDAEVVIVSGTAGGADRLGERYASLKSFKCQRYPAEWDRYGKSAGYRRNEVMAQNADACIVFWDGESRGSKHMIDLAGKYNLILKVVKF